MQAALMRYSAVASASTGGETRQRTSAQTGACHAARCQRCRPRRRPTACGVECWTGAIHVAMLIDPIRDTVPSALSGLEVLPGAARAVIGLGSDPCRVPRTSTATRDAPSPSTLIPVPAALAGGG